MSVLPLCAALGGDAGANEAELGLLRPRGIAAVCRAECGRGRASPSDRINPYRIHVVLSTAVECT